LQKLQLRFSRLQKLKVSVEQLLLLLLLLLL